MTCSAVDRCRAAFAARDDAQCAAELRQCSSLLPLTFEEVAAAGLPRSAVAVAEAESAGQALHEAEATDTGGSYLHAAAAAGAGSVVIQALLAAGLSIGAADDQGATALHVAASSGSLVSIRALLDAGADPLARNKMGRTARGQGGLTEEVRLLLAEAEEAAQAGKAARQEALWGSKVQATQTESAFRTGCL